MNISVFNGTGQVDYMYGLVSGLANNEADHIDVLDVDLTSDLFSDYKNVRYIPVFRVLPRNSSFLKKFYNLIRYYLLQIWFLISQKPRVVHFQWLDRKILVDRLVLPTMARLFGHTVVLTVHNINAAKRDKRDNALNRFTLRYLYSTAHLLIVHTPQSKAELMKEFPVEESKIAIIKHGMNNRVMQRGISREEARMHFGLKSEEKVVLFFGNIDYYKGLDLLVDSLLLLPVEFRQNLKVLIAGNSKYPDYTGPVIEKTKSAELKDSVISRIGYIPDEEVEYYFTAADCIVLPYRNIYQSGVVFMAYTFGLPLLAADVGNFRNDVPEGKAGYLFESGNTGDLSKTILKYFESDMYHNLDSTRKALKDWAWDNYSWDVIGKDTRDAYLTVNRSLKNN
ncbi:MAG: glycosyltransferase family 4 protein [Lentimicrobium sp.]|nr:glycosyltransferase family 4 protein [Lentimicrobium sp.]